MNVKEEVNHSPIESENKESETKQKDKKPCMMLYNIIRKADSKDKWIPLGTCFPNQDGSLNVKLKAKPESDVLHVRSPRGEKPCWVAMPGEAYKVFRLPKGKKEEDCHWEEIGSARGNQDQSLNITLEDYPVLAPGRLQVRKTPNKKPTE